MRELATSLANRAALDAALDKLRDIAKHIGLSSLRDGTWFHSLIGAHLGACAERVDRRRWDRLYPGLSIEERARIQVRNVAYKAAAAGSMASAITSSGELATLFTDGVAGIVGVPGAAVAMVVEAAYTALLRIGLACDLGVIFGVPFSPGDVGEIATLFGLTLDLDVYSQRDQEEEAASGGPSGLAARLAHLKRGEIASRIGRTLLKDSVFRNVVPVIGVAISARKNIVTTEKFAAQVTKYLRGKKALGAAIERLRSTADPILIIQGGWLLATADGEAGHEEMLALDAIMDRLTPDERQAIASNGAYGGGEEQWLGAVGALDKATQPRLLDALFMVATADQELAVPEKRWLEKVGGAIGQTIDVERIDRFWRYLTRGEPVPAEAA